MRTLWYESAITAMRDLLAFVGLLAVLGLLAACLGCKPVTAEAEPPRVDRKYIQRDIDASFSIVEIDGAKYIMVSTPNGVAICPKTRLPYAEIPTGADK